MDIIFKTVVSIAGLIFIIKAIKQWRIDRAVRKSLEPGAGLARVKKE